MDDVPVSGESLALGPRVVQTRIAHAAGVASSPAGGVASHLARVRALSAMTCVHCGTMLQPGSGFCGACGQQQPQQQVAPQPWQQQPPPQQQAPWQQQPQPWQQQPQQPQPQPPQPWPQPMGPTLTPYPLVMQQRITRLTGHLFLAPRRLYFICESQKGGLAVALGKGVGGLIGGAIMALTAPSPGQAAAVIDEGMLQRAVSEKPGSLLMEPAKIKQIKQTMWWRGIWFDGKTYGLPNGLSKPLNQQLALWCQANNVKSAGLKPPT